MFMKKVLIFFVIVVLVCIVVLNVNLNNNVQKNNEVISKFNDLIIKEAESSVESINKYPIIEFNNIDYVGFLIFEEYILPIEKEKKILNSAYLTKGENLLIEGTNLKNSFEFYKYLTNDDTFAVVNMLSEKNEYKIKEIKHVSKDIDISQYDNDLIVMIKLYNEFNNLLILCDMN